MAVAGDTIYHQFVTKAVSGALVDADALPVGTLVRNGVDTEISVTITNKAVGVYVAQFTIPSAYVAGDEVALRITATIGGVTTGAVVWQETLTSGLTAVPLPGEGAEPGTIVTVAALRLELGISASATAEEIAVAEWAILKAEGAVKRFLRYDPVLKRRTEYYPRADLSLGKVDSVWEASETEAYVRMESMGQTSGLQLQHIPVRSSPAMDLRIDYNGRSGTRAGAFAAETARTEGEDFWPNYDLLDSSGNKMCRDGLLRSIGLWPLTAGTVKVEYTAGYTAEELQGADDVIDASPIWEAVLEEAKRRVEQVMVRKKSSVGWTAGPKSSERLGDYSYSIDSSLAKALYGSSAGLTDQSMMLLEPFVNKGWEL